MPFCVCGNRLCKTYHSFRTLAGQLKKIAEKGCSEINGSITRGSMPPDVCKAIKFAESVYDLVDSESYEHFGKVCIEAHSYLDGIIAASLSSPTLLFCYTTR